MDHGARNYQRYLNGDDDAFVEIIKDYKDGLILYLNSFTKDLHIAEDLMEDVFVRIVTRKPYFRQSASFKTWLYTIARNIACDWHRKSAKQKTVPIEDAAADLIAAIDMEQHYLCQERRILLHRSLRKICPQYAQILYLVYFEDFSNEQAATIMKKNRRQIENLLYRAKSALKRELEKGGFVYEGLL